MTSRRARLVRAALAAALTTFVAALSHSLAGAQAPGSLAVVLSATFSLLVCIALTGKQLSVWRLSIAVTASQSAYHGLFTLFGPDGVASPSGSGAVRAAHDHASAAAQFSALNPSGASGFTDDAMAGHGGGWMLVAHALAALLTIAALRYGEGTFWRLFDGSLVFVRSLFAHVPVLPVFERALIRISSGRDAALPQDLQVLISSMRRRGPPQELQRAR